MLCFYNIRQGDYVFNVCINVKCGKQRTKSSYGRYTQHVDACGKCIKSIME
jgi:hypothetical protein